MGEAPAPRDLGRGHSSQWNARRGSVTRYPERSGTALRVLVAEDDDASRVQLKDAVESLGYVCCAARDGQSALELHHRDPFDVVLSDWLMPRMDGPALCRTFPEKG